METQTVHEYIEYNEVMNKERIEDEKKWNTLALSFAKLCSSWATS
jgi:hypothetical protein